MPRANPFALRPLPCLPPPCPYILAVLLSSSVKILRSGITAITGARPRRTRMGTERPAARGSMHHGDDDYGDRAPGNRPAAPPPPPATRPIIYEAVYHEIFKTHEYSSPLAQVLTRLARIYRGLPEQFPGSLRRGVPASWRGSARGILRDSWSSCSS